MHLHQPQLFHCKIPEGGVSEELMSVSSRDLEVHCLSDRQQRLEYIDQQGWCI